MHEFLRHNRNLVRTAQHLRAYLGMAADAMSAVVDHAQPVSAAHESEPSEYVVSADDMAALRDAAAAARQWCGRGLAAADGEE